MSHLTIQPGYCTGEFNDLQLIVLAAFVVLDWPLAFCMFVHFLEIQLSCSFDIMNCKSSFFCILTHVVIYILLQHMILRLYLYILNLNSVLYFYQVRTPVVTFPIDVVFTLDIQLSSHKETCGFVVAAWTNQQLVWISIETTQIARFMGPTWGPSGADRTQVGPMLAPWTLLSGKCSLAIYSPVRPLCELMHTK